MSDFHKIIDRHLAAGEASAVPPDWLVAPHLRKRGAVRAAPVSPGCNDNHPPRPPSPRPTRARTIPFPLWCDDRGLPLAALLGPPRWREVIRF